MKDMEYCPLETVFLSFADIEHIQKTIARADEKKKLFVIDLGSTNDINPIMAARHVIQQATRLSNIGIPVLKYPRDIFSMEHAAVFALQYGHAHQPSILQYQDAGINYFIFHPLVKILSKTKGNDWCDFSNLLRYPDIIVDLRGSMRNDQMYNEALFDHFKKLVASDRLPPAFSAGIILASRHRGNVNVFFKTLQPLPVG